MARMRTPAPGSRNAVPAGSVGTTGALLGVAAVGSLSAHADPPVWRWVEVVVLSTTTAAIVATAHWLANSDYETGDVWTVPGWSVLGVAGAGLLTGLLYVHQRAEGMTVAEPAFLFETLALVGAALGVAVAVDWTSLVDRRLLAGTDDQTGSVALEDDADPDAASTVLGLLDARYQSLSAAATPSLSSRRRSRIVPRALTLSVRWRPYTR